LKAAHYTKKTKSANLLRPHPAESHALFRRNAPLVYNPYAMQTLNDIEIRILGVLIEKELATPDYYPLTLNALVTGCNQLTGRHPVMNLDDKTVARGLDTLRQKRLIHEVHQSGSRVAKYKHVVLGVYGMNVEELSLLCALLLRGPQTVGELRSHTSRMWNFGELSEVEASLEKLARQKPDALAVQLPRLPGRKEARFMHLLAGEINLEELEAQAAHAAPARVDAAMRVVHAENERIAKLEEEVAALRGQLSELQSQFDEFRRQFE
jgi:uncharacterized protein YceH (UPF0502 family)